MVKEFFNHNFDANSGVKLGLNGKKLELAISTDAGYLFDKLRGKLVNEKWTGKLAGLLISAAEEYIGLNAPDAASRTVGQSKESAQPVANAVAGNEPKLPEGSFKI